MTLGFLMISMRHHSETSVCSSKETQPSVLLNSPDLELPQRNYSSDYELVDTEDNKDAKPTYRRKIKHVIKMGTFLTAYDSQDWHGIQSPIFFYIYSAFYDDRPEFGSPRIALIGISELHEASIYCALSVSGTQGPYYPLSFTFQGVTPDAILQEENKRVADFIYWCPMKWKQIPSQVVIGLRIKNTNEYKELARVDVEVPKKPTEKQDIAICVAHLYKPSISLIMGKKRPLLDNPYEMVEWVEMQKILGIDKISLYIQAVGSEVMKVLQYYSKEGNVDIHSFGLIEDKVFKYPRSTAVSDCLHRYMHSHEMILVIDVDEVIVPQEDITFMELLKRVARANNIAIKGNHFQFANDIYYTDQPDHKVDKTKPFYLQYLRHRYHTGPEPFPGPMKSAQDPYVCKYTTNHQCFISVPGANKVYVDPTIASVHHYKDCSTARDQTRESQCIHRRGNTTIENIMLRYEDRLVPAVKNTLSHLQLS